MNDFSLYREAKDNYSRLIPDKRDGLIILSLFTKFGDASFTEENLISVIDDYYKDTGGDTEKNFFERNNNIILRLQESFLWRNKRDRTYQFKKYGLEFCQNIENRLMENYNPAKIKRWFSQLLNTLEQTYSNNEDFNLWVVDNFELKQPSLLSQIEILDQQVNQSVIDFRNKIRSKDEDVLATLEQIEIGLDVIKQQSSELKSAFTISYDIDEILTHFMTRENAIDYVENIKRVREFHNKSRNHLEHVSNRIDRIKPQIREFIYNFNRENFDRKTDDFIHFLLKYSKVDKTDKRVVFPAGIGQPIVRKKSKEPKLMLIPIMDFTPKASTKVAKRIINQENREKLIDKTKKWKREKERIVYWYKKALLEVESQEIFHFSPYFCGIVEEDGFSIAVKTAHRILRETASNKKYNLTITTDPFFQSSDSNIALWTMTIQIK